MTEENGNNKGCPSKFREEFVQQAYQLCLLGATDKDLASFFGVCEKTINNWKKEFDSFLQSIKKGKEIADMHLANKLFNRAEGAEWLEDQAFKVKRVEYVDGKKAAEYEEVVTVPVKRAAPPDVTALIFWLKNRKSDFWRDKVETKLTGSADEPVHVVADDKFKKLLLSAIPNDRLEQLARELESGGHQEGDSAPEVPQN